MQSYCNDFDYCIYRQTSNISSTEFPNLSIYRLDLQLSLSNPLKPDVENDDVVGAALTGDAPTTFELSTTVLPTKVRLILVFDGIHNLQTVQM